MGETRERPILFSGPMVRAILEGRKTQTRRVVTLPPWATKDGLTFANFDEPGPPAPGFPPEFVTGDWGPCPRSFSCPYGVPGDRLWVRETFGLWRRTSVECSLEWDTIEGSAAQALEQYGRQGVNIAYRADGDDPDGWRPSIFMPRWASRITLEITDVRVQRLQEMDYLDAYDEGIPEQGGNSSDGIWRVVSKFRDLWDSINAKRGFGWDKNPFVWALTFRRIDA